MNIRTLKADEIECRVQTVKETGCSLLLYKDARCDMRILDEVFGAENWQRNHELINGNLFCNVGVRFPRETGFGEWVWKQDVGVESNTEKEKGQASDSFKRACFNWGIGRELYTAPFIWIALTDQDISKNGNKVNVNTKFHVKDIGYNENKEIVKLVIADNKGKVRYTLGKADIEPTESSRQTGLDKDKLLVIRELAKEVNVSEAYICKVKKVNKLEELSVKDWVNAMEWLKKKQAEKEGA